MTDADAEAVTLGKPVDEAPTLALAETFMRAIRDHYLSRPTSRDSVFEVLNALAGTTAEVIRPCDERALAFFHAALRQNLADA